ncbi:MAG: hypothetical protein J7524_15075, partial [Roseofilum sp. Belize BBD 4]
AYSWELICRKNGAIACLVYTLRFRKAKAFRRVTEEGYHEFTGKAWDAVDSIYYDARCSLLSARVERSPWEGILISDRFPVVAQVLLR